mmetsp:Transcript_28125/g.46284  ORF Transcript_28125/g.46284 Transcript_28125/m.46284 type:complete len:622 (-) Transcript_28125:116-1981(-)
MASDSEVEWYIGSPLRLDNIVTIYLDNYWWGLPLQVLMVVYCVIAFNVIVTDRLLPSLDAFCRNWNLQHFVAQSTIYSLGAIAPIFVISLEALLLDVSHLTSNCNGTHAMHLGFASVVGFCLCIASFMPSFASLISCYTHGVIATLPATSTVRDQLFLILLISIHTFLIFTGELAWWKCVVTCFVYIVYVLSIILYYYIESFWRKSNPLESHRLLCRFQSASYPFEHYQYQSFLKANSPSRSQSQSRLQLRSESDSLSPAHELPPLPPTVEHKQACDAAASVTQPVLNHDVDDDQQYLAYHLKHRGSATKSKAAHLSPDIKSLRSMQSNKSSIVSLRHPMLMDERDVDFVIDEIVPEQSEYESELESPTRNDGNIDRIHLETPTHHPNTYHIHPTIRFLASSNAHHEHRPNSRGESDRYRQRCTLLYTVSRVVYRVVSYPVRLLVSLTVPSCQPYDQCECVYPVTFLLSAVWIVGVALVLLIVAYHWSQIFGLSLVIVGVLCVGPINTILNIVDCVMLSLQGYAVEIIANAIHLQISSIFYGVTVPLFIHAVTAEDPIQMATEKKMFYIYLGVSSLQAIVLFVPICGRSKEIIFSVQKAIIYLAFYVCAATVLFYMYTYIE